MLATASAQVCVPLGHSSLYFTFCINIVIILFLANKLACLLADAAADDGDDADANKRDEL